MQKRVINNLQTENAIVKQSKGSCKLIVDVNIKM